MRHKLIVAVIGASLLLAACDETGTTTASSPSSAPEPTVISQSEPFPYPRSRVLSRPGDTTALVEVRSLSNAPENIFGIEDAAREFCGGDALVGLPVSTNRMGLTVIRQYLVRCQ